MNNNILYMLWFANRIHPGSKRMKTLFEQEKDPEKIYKMTSAELRKIYPLDNRTYEKLCDKSLEREKLIIEKCREIDCHILTCLDDNYPARLRQISSYPYVIYHRGLFFDFGNVFSIAIVGARHPSKYGYDMAVKFAKELAYNDCLVISGMAMGVDGAAHYGAMSMKKPTVAVLGSGIDVIQPACNSNLYTYMIENGAVFSEYPPGTHGLARYFPARNRIISALSAGVLVVEAGLKSGSLITADFAVEQGKDVFAIPHPINNPGGEGTNKLIKDYAIPVTGVNDILDEYKILFTNTDNIAVFNDKTQGTEFVTEDFISRFDDLTPLEEEIIRFMKDEPVGVDVIASLSGISVDKILSSMTMLEIKGVIKSEPGNRFGLNIERNE